MFSKLLAYSVSVAYAAEPITLSYGTDTPYAYSFDYEEIEDLSNIAALDRYDPLQFDYCALHSAYPDPDAEPTNYSFQATLSEVSDVTSIHLLNSESSSVGGMTVTVGDEVCFIFPERFSAPGWSYIDCSGLTASDTITFTYPFDYEFCGVIVDTDEADVLYKSFHLADNEELSYFTKSPLCGDYAEVPDSYYPMFLETYVEESEETAGSYYLKHVCPADELVYTLSVGEPGDCETDLDCATFSNDESAEHILLELVNLGELDTFYAYIDSSEDAEYEEYGKATLAYYQNMKDLTDLRALAERDIQQHLGCFEEASGAHSDVRLYEVDVFKDSTDTLSTDCLDLVQVMGFEYAYLYDGLCMGVYEHEEFLAYLADTDYASDAEECDLEAENYYYFEEDYDSTMTFGGYTHADVYKLIPEPEVEESESEQEDELSATEGFAVGYAAAAIAAAFVM